MTAHSAEIWKALAALVAAAAVFAGGGVLTVSSWWHPAPQTINATVRIEGGSLPR